MVEIALAHRPVRATRQCRAVTLLTTRHPSPRAQLGGAKNSERDAIRIAEAQTRAVAGVLDVTVVEAELVESALPTSRAPVDRHSRRRRGRDRPGTR